MSLEDCKNLTDVLTGTITDFVEYLEKRGESDNEIITIILGSLNLVVAGSIQASASSFEEREKLLQNMVYVIRNSPGWKESDND